MTRRQEEREMINMEMMANGVRLRQENDELKARVAELEEAEREVQRCRYEIETLNSLMISGERRGVEKGREESRKTIDELKARVAELEARIYELDRPKGKAPRGITGE